VDCNDPSVIEAASWRLASELIRRHPGEARLIRAHPGGGQYDVLWILGEPPYKTLDIRMNRTGTIQIHGRADGYRDIDWQPTQWVEYLLADPQEFIMRLERSAGWPSPPTTPIRTPVTLTYRVLAALTAVAFKTVHPVSVSMGYIDSSGHGGGRNWRMSEFNFPSALTENQKGDPYQEPGYRFWITTRDDRSLIAIEQTSATAWFLDGGPPIDLMAAYKVFKKEPALVAAELLRRALG
jgi:hypothetical protein